MNDRRQTYSIEEIKGLLFERRREVAMHYAPPRCEWYEDRGLYFTLNPGRADRSVGSFVVALEGEKAGRWNDYATAEHGDLIDLIRLSLGCSITDALREARSYLGLAYDSPGDVARRKAAAERSKRLAEEARAKGREQAERRRRGAVALWLSGQERIKSTPVEHYLRDTRGIDLAQLGRQPGALRYHPAVRYKHLDRETGEVWDCEMPAMLAIVNDGQGRSIACHRTWLAMRPDGRWDKAPVPKPKKVLGDYAGGSIHLWRGIQPSGRRNKPLADAPQGSHLFISEGIEDALSCAILLPQARVIAAISLSNFGGVVLPPAISSVTLIADRDPGPDAQAALQRAIAAHQKAGRQVRVWMNRDGGKDLNDALRARLQQQQKEDEGQEHGSEIDRAG
ncbi:Toprim domain-containing protein [Paracoccus pantotrophus]|nr:Toprim domain-containing protein [Paracoccus pantotrophus]